MPISAPAGRSAASASGSPRRVCRTSSPSMASISTTKAKCGCEGQVRLWPYARANGEHTVDVLRRLRAEWPEDKLIVVWDGASYHRACVVREAAEALNIDLVPLPGYLHAGRACRSRRSGAGSGRMSPIITAIPPPRISAAGWPLSKHASIRTPALTQDACADRLWVKDHLDPDEEKLRFSR